MDQNNIVRHYHTAALASFFGLFILLMAWHTLLMPSPQFPVAMVLIVTVTPLLLPMRGFLKGKAKSCAWMAYVSLLYIIHGIVEAYANPPERLFALAEALLGLTLFFSATYYVRYLNKG